MNHNATATPPLNQPIEVSLPRDLNFLAPVEFRDLVRIGRENDGGYVIPISVLMNADFLISMGIRDDWSFEKDLALANPGVIIHAYDHTVSERLFLRDVIASLLKATVGMSNIHDILERAKRLISYRKFFRNRCTHYQERIHNRIDHSYDAEFKKILSRTNSKNIFIKMDIEGSEYRVIDDIIENSDVISGMVVEFHDTEPFREVFTNSVKKLKTAFEIVHIHANNYSNPGRDGLPEVLELTFVRKDLCSCKKLKSDFPVNDLDCPNDPFQQDYRLHFQT